MVYKKVDLDIRDAVKQVFGSVIGRYYSGRQRGDHKKGYPSRMFEDYEFDNHGMPQVALWIDHAFDPDFIPNVMLYPDTHSKDRVLTPGGIVGPWEMQFYRTILDYHKDGGKKDIYRHPTGGIIWMKAEDQDELVEIVELMHQAMLRGQTTTPQK